MPKLTEQLKGMTFKQKAEHIWEYYKLHMIATLAVVVLGILFVSSFTGKEESFDITVVGRSPVVDSITASDQLNDSFKDFNIAVDVIHSPESTFSSISNQQAQKMLVRAAAGEIDLLILDENIYQELSQQDPFTPLEDFIASSNLEIPDESLYSGKQNMVYGINTSSIPSLKEFSYLQNKVLCVFSSASEKDEVKQFLTLILKE
ncbi:hypothetical protein [Mesobacillus foraminis]|uniref:Extracellular solute-binding protein n=1 Tax=Mesobacillus foraminis TaxID=279826 RepID=A0A4R2BMR2_9BACI|nr:hypothetical protein [Mesobacillus foraminis]TCN27479.1 hypothetical protein EV146_102433 [Mesobacillus foraminis]